MFQVHRVLFNDGVECYLQELIALLISLSRGIIRRNVRDKYCLKRVWKRHMLHQKTLFLEEDWEETMTNPNVAGFQKVR